MATPNLGFATQPSFPSDLNDLVEGLGAIVWQADTQTFKFIRVSRHAEVVLGYPVEQWLNEPNFWVDHIHPDDRETAVNTCVVATARGQDHQFEYRAVAADGRVVWLRDIVRVVPDAHGEPRELRGVMFDITEQKQAEAALRESENRFRQLTDNIREVFFIFDPRAETVIYMSPAFEQVYGHSSQAVHEQPRSFLTLIHPEDRARVTANYEKVLGGGAVASQEYRVVWATGEVHWIWDRTFPVHNEAGEVYRLVGIAEDVTELKEAELVLRESEERFRKVFEEGPGGMAIVGPDWRIRQANEALCRMLARSEAELQGLTLVDVTYPEDRNRDTDLSRHLLEGRIPSYSLEKRLLKPDGEIVWVNLSTTMIRTPAGEPLYGLHMVSDITGHRYNEDRLRELTGRLMRLQDEERRRIARELHDSTGQNLAALKLNLSRLRAVYLEPELRSIVPDSLALTERTLQELRTLSYLLHPPLLDELGLSSALRVYVDGFSQRSGIVVELDLPPNPLPLARDLELAIFRVVQECLTNIHRHSGSRQSWVSLSSTGDSVHLEIRDAGKGLPADVLDRLRNGSGPLGVGLSGMHERARQLGGALEIQSSAAGCSVRGQFPLRS